MVGLLVRLISGRGAFPRDAPAVPISFLERTPALTYWSRAHERGPAARAALNDLSALAGSARTAVELREIAAEIRMTLLAAERAADAAAQRAVMLTARPLGADRPGWVADPRVPAVVRLSSRPERALP
jgi:hypothetical protein